jgi:hypothetical protein
MGSAGGIGSLRLIPGVSTLYVLGEPGPANAKAVRDVSARWIADGRKVIVAHPEIGADMNDALAGRIVGKAVA